VVDVAPSAAEIVASIVRELEKRAPGKVS